MPCKLGGAGDGARTRDIQLGRLALYRLSYPRLLAPTVLGDATSQFYRMAGRLRLPVLHEKKTGCRGPAPGPAQPDLTRPDLT